MKFYVYDEEGFGKFENEEVGRKVLIESFEDDVDETGGQELLVTVDNDKVVKVEYYGSDGWKDFDLKEFEEDYGGFDEDLVYDVVV